MSLRSLNRSLLKKGLSCGILVDDDYAPEEHQEEICLYIDIPFMGYEEEILYTIYETKDHVYDFKAENTENGVSYTIFHNEDEDSLCKKVDGLLLCYSDNESNIQDNNKDNAFETMMKDYLQNNENISVDSSGFTISNHKFFLENDFNEVLYLFIGGILIFSCTDGFLAHRLLKNIFKYFIDINQ
ncbi:MAG: hypothetical protein PF569_03890 [Candidatus Woesearchaeota archaeon]|jgi:hypothetical protein|nr:hypothetical protein [Candidatus Woesearchaeota archaeon]